MIHMDQKILQRYMMGTLSAAQEEEMMQHIAQCDKCAAEFATQMMQQELLSPPPDLKKDILRQTVGKQNVMGKKQVAEQTKRNGGFWAYSAKVAFAMAASIVMLFTLSDYSVQSRQAQFASEGAVSREQKIFADSTKESRKKIAQAKKESEQKKEAHKREQKEENIGDSLQKMTGRAGDALFGTLHWITEE